MADRYFVSGGDGNWGSTSNWSTTSGGSGGSSVPTSSDAVHLDANSPNCVVNASNRVCQSLNCTGYTGTLTMDFGITSSGSVTLASGMTISGTAGLSVATTATLTSNGKTWPNALTIAGGANYTVTFSDNWIVDGLVTVGNSAGNTHTLNGSGLSITCNGGVTWVGSASFATSHAGNLKYIIGGGIVTMASGNSTLFNPVDLNSAGTITFPNGNFFTTQGNLTYVAGTIVFDGTHQLRVFGTLTLDLNGITWPTLVINTNAGNRTLTLANPLSIAGSVTVGTLTVTWTINGHSITFGGNLTLSGFSSGRITGTTEFIATGTDTGTIALSGGSGTNDNPLEIDAPNADVTISSVFPWRLANFVAKNYKSITSTEEWQTASGGTTPIPRGMTGGFSMGAHP